MRMEMSSWCDGRLVLTMRVKRQAEVELSSVGLG